MTKNFFSFVALRFAAAAGSVFEVAGSLFGKRGFWGSGGVGFLLVMGVMAGEAGAYEYKVANLADPINVTAGNCPSSDPCVISGYAAGKRVNIAANANVIFRGLTIIGSGYYAVSVNGTGVVIKLEQSNVLTGGVGGAGLRVPLNSDVTINGPGTLIATGGQRRALITADAGAGIGGGNITNPNNNADSIAGNRTDNCGKVTINGGDITAYGGGSGVNSATAGSATTNPTGHSYGAGIGGSGYNAHGCELIINGGNVTAYGGRQGYNDIGPGLRYANTDTNDTDFKNALTINNTYFPVIINGGSVNAKIYEQEEITNTTFTGNTTNSPVIRTSPSMKTGIDPNVVTDTVARTCQALNSAANCSSARGCTFANTTNTQNYNLTPNRPRGFCNRSAGCTFIYTSVTGATQTVTVNQNYCVQFTPNKNNIDITNFSEITNTTFTGNTTNSPLIVTSRIATTGIDPNVVTDTVARTCQALNSAANCSSARGCTFANTTNTQNYNLTPNRPRGFCNRSAGCTFIYTSVTGATQTVTVNQNYCVQFTPSIFIKTENVKNNLDQKVSQQILKVGAVSDNLETQDARVTACKFGSLQCDSTTVTSRYGIKDVKTDYDKKLYFWLPSYSGNTNDFIKLNLTSDGKTYNYSSKLVDTSTFKGPPPLMTHPEETPNSFVGHKSQIGQIVDANDEICKNNNEDPNCPRYNAVGSYRTGFRMQGSQNVAAVGHEIAVFKGGYDKDDPKTGRYIQNDSEGEAANNLLNDDYRRFHSVRWCRTSNPSEANKGKDKVCDMIIQNSEGFLYGYDPSNPQNPQKYNATYTPTKYDYGNYIWAEVYVRDMGSIPANNGIAIDGSEWNNEESVVKYPAIRVGVVVDVAINGGTGNDVRSTVTRNSVSREKNLFFYDEIGNISALAFPTTESPESPIAKLHYAWNTSVGTFGSELSSSSIANPVIFNLPAPCNTSLPANCSNEDDLPNDDISLGVEVTSGDIPQISHITFNAQGRDGDILHIDVSSETNSGEILTSSYRYIPSKGIITLTFGVYYAESPSIGSIVLSPSSGGNPIILENGIGLNNDYSEGCTSNCPYVYFTYGGIGQQELEFGQFYNILVKDFNNGGRPMLNFTLNRLEVESLASIAWGQNGDGETNYYGAEPNHTFILGKTLKGEFEYDPKQAGDISGLCYKWDVQSSRNAPVSENSLDDCTELTTAPYEVPDLEINASNINIYFGNWVRLLVRPMGAKPIKGGTNYEGDIIVGAAKQIGVLLKPGTLTQTTTCEGSAPNTYCKAYQNVTFAGACTPGENADLLFSGCFTDGYMVYEKNVEVRLSVLPNPDYQLSGWKDDNDNTCDNDPPFTCGKDSKSIQFSYYTITDVAEKGQIEITPQVVPSDLPKVISAKLKQIGDRDGSCSTSGTSDKCVDLTTGDKDNIDVLSNILEIVLDPTPDATNGKVEFIKVESADTISLGTDSNDGSYFVLQGSNLKIFLDFYDSRFTKSPNSSVFEKNYRIRVLQFVGGDNHEAMMPEAFNFTTAAGPSVDAPVLTGKVGPTDKEEFAVGNSISFNSTTLSTSYKPNGGSTANTHGYCWEISDTRHSSNAPKSVCDSTGTSFTPNGETRNSDLNKYVRLIVTPTDIDGKTGTPVASEWGQIGVLLKMATDAIINTNNVTGTNTVRVGTEEITEGGDGVVAFGEGTAIRWSSTNPNVGIVKWTIGGTEQTSTENAINYSFSSPKNNISIALQIDDNSTPTIFASVNNGPTPNITLEFNKPVKSLLDGEGNYKTITIKSESGLTYTFTLTATHQSTVSDDGKNIIQITLSDFTNDGTGYILSSSMDTLKIGAAAFVDLTEKKNVTLGSDKLALLTSGSFYAIQLSDYFVPVDEEYGCPYSLDGTILNRSTGTVGLSVKEGNGPQYFDFAFTGNYDNMPQEQSTSTAGFTITLKPENIPKVNWVDGKLDGYDDFVIISGNNGIEEKISLKLKIRPRVLSYGTPANFANPAETSREYNGGTESPLINWAGDWTPSSCPTVQVSDAKVKFLAGDYSDPYVGSNKPITITYEIVDNETNETPGANENYTFSDGMKLSTTSHRLPVGGSITPRKLGLSIAETATLEKEYDGSNNIEIGVDDILLDRKVGSDIVSIRPSPIFSLDSPNAGSRTINTVIGMSLDGTDASNYELGTPDEIKASFSSTGITITPASLATLLAQDNVSYCETEGCATGSKVTAAATYGSLLNRSSQLWPPEGDAEVIKNGITVPGTWTICGARNDIPTVCDGKVGSAFVDKNTPAPTETVNGYYAYFAPSERNSGNYASNLIVPVDLTVSKRAIEITANLASAGNIGDGMKTYDGEATLFGVEPGNFEPAVYGDNLYGVTASASFANANAGNGKLLTVNWDLNGTNAGNKYTAGQTLTLGSIAKRKVNLMGITVEPKFYDGTTNATNVNYSSINLEQYEQAMFRQQKEVIDGKIQESDIDPYIGIVNDDDVSVLPAAPGLNFQFFTPNADTDKQIASTNGINDFQLNGTKAGNYELVLFSLKGDIFPASIADILCTQIENAICPENTKAAKDAWVEANRSIIAAHLAKAELEGTYGDPLSSIQNKISTVMPNTIGELFNITGDTRTVTWAWSSNEGIKTVGGVGLAKTVGNAYFVHGDQNYETNITVPISVTAAKRQLTATLVPEDKSYDTTDNVIIRVIPGNVISGDDVSLIAYGATKDANAGVGKEVSILTNIDWTPEIKQYLPQLVSNYHLPNIGQHTSPDASTLTVSISKIPWPNAVKPTPAEYSILYDSTINLASIPLSPAGWQWEKANDKFPDPNTRLANPTNLAAIDRTYRVTFAPPADAANYMEAEDNIKISIRKRSEDNSVKSAVVNAACGADTASITVTANDANAQVWFNNTIYGEGNGTFSYSGLNYGENRIPYQIQAQAYGEGFFRGYSLPYTRYLPFAKVAGGIRGKSLTITLDSSQRAEQDFFAKRKFDIAKTEWYSGTTIVATGRNLAVSSTDTDDYWVRLYTTDGNIYQSCKISGAEPALTPIAPPATSGGIKMIASSFGSRVVAGGTTLTLNTPQGGIITVYTMKGEQVSKMNAIDSRTVVKIPNSKGMYIVKLEAK